MITDYNCPPKTFAAGNDDVRLTVAVGNGDFGTTRVTLNGKVLVQGSPIVNGLLVGQGSELHGSDLIVDTIVNDTNPVTDKTVVYYRLQCGGVANNFDHTCEVPSNGDSVVYHAPIHLS